MTSRSIRKTSSRPSAKPRIAGKMVPVLCGSSFKNKGIQKLLDAIIDFLPSPLDKPPVKGHSIDDTEKIIERKPSDG